MNTLIQDKLHDADWLCQFGDFIYNFVVYPTAIMKNPSGCDETVEALNGQRVWAQVTRAVENISFDFYPSTKRTVRTRRRVCCGNPQCSRSELVGYYSAPGFDGEGIRQVMKNIQQAGSKNARTARTITPEVDRPICHWTWERRSRIWRLCRILQAIRMNYSRSLVLK